MTTLSVTRAQSAASLAVELNGAAATIVGSGDSVTALLDPLRVGRNTLTITLSATGASDRTYTVELRRASDEPTGWAVLGDFTLDAANHAPTGMWSDGTHLWVAQSKGGDGAAAWIFAYGLGTGDRVPGEEFTSTVLSAAFNLNPVGIWSDGTTMWVADSADNKIYAYDLGTKVRDAAKDIGDGPYTYLQQQGNTSLIGIWSDGTTMWVANDGSDAGDGAHNKIFAYNIASKLRDESKEFNTLAAAGNRSPKHIWSDGKTMWVRNSDRFGTNVKLYAYSMTTRRHLPHKDFNTLKTAGNAAPRGIWGDGSVMWVADTGDRNEGVVDTVYTYNYAAPAGDTTLHSLTLSDIGEGGADTALPLTDGLREHSATALDAAVTATTLTPVVTDAADYAVYLAGETIPADITTDTARLNMPREVTLHAWNDTVVTVAVRAEDGSATVVYTATVRRWDLDFAYTAPVAGTSDEQWELEVTFAQEASVAASPPVSEIELNWQWSLAGSAFAADGTDDADSDAATDRVWRIEVTPHPSFKGPLAASLPAGMFLYGTSGSPAMAEQVEEEINTGPAVWITLTDDDNVAGDGATFDVRFTFTSNYINGSPVGDRDPNAADVDETDFLISDIVVGNGTVTSLTELGPITVDPDDYVANDEYTAEEQAQRLENAREHAAHRLLLLGSLYDATITPGTDCPSMSKNPCVVTVDVPAGAAKDQAGMFNRAGDRLSVTRRTEATTAYVAALTIRRQTVTNHYNVLILIKRGADVVEDLDFATHFQLTGGDLRAESKWPGSYEFWISPTADATAANPLQIKVDLNKDGDFADADEVVYEIDDAKKVTTFLPPAAEARSAQAQAAAVAIPDAGLRALLESALRKEPGAAITPDDLSTLVLLNLRGQDVADLTGLEHAVNLAKLYLDDTGLDLGPVENLWVTVYVTGSEPVVFDGPPPRSADASLSALTLSGAEVAFDPATLEYAVGVGHDVAQTTVTATPADESAGYAVTLDGEADEDGTVELAVGENAVAVVVTAEDGKTVTTYTVTVTRAAPPAPTAAFELSPSGPVEQGMAVAVTMTFANLTFDADRATTDYIFRADVKTLDNEDADGCEGSRLGLDRHIYQVDEDPEVREGTISADCPAGDYAVQVTLTSPDDGLLAAASAIFSVVEPAPAPTPTVTAAVELSPAGPVTVGTEVVVTMTFGGLTFDADRATTDYVFRADVVGADGCEGSRLGLDRYMYQVDEDPEVRKGTVSAACAAGGYTLRVGISSADDGVELASASTGFTVVEPAPEPAPEPEPDPPALSADATLRSLALSGVTLAFDPATTRVLRQRCQRRERKPPSRRRRTTMRQPTQSRSDGAADDGRGNPARGGRQRYHHQRSPPRTVTPPRPTRSPSPAPRRRSPPTPRLAA